MQPFGRDDVVLFLNGRIATNDGTSLPHDALVERICNNTVRQQVYASPHGDFTMQMGTRSDFLLDATGGPISQEGVVKRSPVEGIPRNELANCEIRASVTGFRSNVISLVSLTPSDSTIDVGAIVVQRVTNIKGMTLNAAAYKAPSNAVKAYEKGLEAETNGKLPEARRCFEQAVQIYPKYATAWFQLGTVLEKQRQKDSARAAYTQASTIESKFLSPYLSLAKMAFEARNWTEVLQFTGHVIDLDLLNHGNLSGYVLDLDDVIPAEVYFYNAAANYKLNKFAEAEKSALKAEHVDLLNHFPQLHLLLADIFARKSDNAVVISELRRYLEVAPLAKDSDRIRERLEKLEELSRSAPASEKPPQN